MSAEYKTEQVELKYIEFKTPWNIFEKHRGKRVFNVPNDLSICVDNPNLVLESDLIAAQAEIARLKEENQKLELLSKQAGSKGYAQRTLELIYENQKLQSALDVAVEGLEYYSVGRCLYITGEVNTSIAKSALDKIKQIRE